MAEDYSKHLELIRQLRELGALSVSVGTVSVTFPPLVREPAAEELPPVDDKAWEEMRKKIWEQENYFSSGG